ncbi:MAG: UDP-N-acetylmuramoyl-L-alanine--D-glutamate ligase [Desulfobacter sp.]|nr:MAG: UDP-N-acetylmuramoyl-L-alanine--D-glutamate ligase [Desulfobacter sp.]
MARFLKSMGRRVVATDIDGSKTHEAAALEALGIRTQIGSHDQSTFDGAERIVPSPGIPLTLPYIQNAAAKGVKITGELDIFGQYNTTPVIAVTGSNGKTTTTNLISAMAEACGLSCFVGGNIGIPLVEYLMSGIRQDLVVAEVSSFQLDLATTFSPNVGVLLNISPDHLDRYPDFKAYRDSKWSLFARQGGNDAAVVNTGIQNFDKRVSPLSGRIFSFSPETGTGTADLRFHFKDKEICIPAAAFKALPGGHNRENIAAAAISVLAAGGNEAGICKGLEDFAPLPHRTQFIRELNGVRFYNDSKATNTDAVARALQAFEAPIILILGGREKDTDFTELIPSLGRVKEILALGEASRHIVEALGALHRVTRCTTMADAVARAAGMAVAGDIVLLSPACASFDMYKDYKARGRDFSLNVKQLEKEAAHG